MGRSYTRAFANGKGVNDLCCCERGAGGAELFGQMKD